MAWKGFSTAGRCSGFASNPQPGQNTPRHGATQQSDTGNATPESDFAVEIRRAET
jgi:hypothetical protein